MKRLILLGGICLAGGLLGATPGQAAVEEDFMAACIGAYGEDSREFCGCKTDQAKLLDNEEMMRHFIAFYQDPNQFRQDVAAGKVPEEIQTAWPRFVMESNKVCLQPAE